ncbi:MAG TPA: SURF1 family cytochrome oxidase biogenesis protein [Stellaceae bacterium]|nr:SURF1 family cytochrome oxidase biogenesis protein [Stellaceae bacterium]
MARKSLLPPTLFTLFGLALLLGLGTWQVQRLHWKEGLIAAREAGLRAAPVPLPEDPAAAEALAFRPVTASGRLLAGRALHLHATSSAGVPGWRALAPLVLPDGAAILVAGRFATDRGAPGFAAGPQSVTGLLRLPQRRGWFVPDDRPAANEWFAIDLPAMAKAARLDRLLPYYIDASGEKPPDLPNNHLQYAATWYALAAALLVFYILLIRRHRREARRATDAL